MASLCYGACIFVQVYLSFQRTVSTFRTAENEQQRMYKQCDVFFLLLLAISMLFAAYHYKTRFVILSLRFYLLLLVLYE